jgi:hypothetical protein
MRETTKMKIERAINQEVRANKANKENDEKTILDLYNKVDQLETRVYDLERENGRLLIEGGAINDIVELSD